MAEIILGLACIVKLVFITKRGEINYMGNMKNKCFCCEDHSQTRRAWP